MGANAVVSVVLASSMLACSASVPRDVDDACGIFDEKPAWYHDARKAYRRWGVPIPVQLAIVYQESRFRPKAKPPRKKLLWVLPGPRPSSAYGYAQALDSTWDEYLRDSGNRGADRDDFADAVDFVAWYCARSSRVAGIGKNDAFALYLAYHEGAGGYRRGTYRGKSWLVKTARKVEQRAVRYRRQLARCENSLNRGGMFGWLWPF